MKERRCGRARRRRPVSQRKTIGGERARLEKIVVEKQGAERRGRFLQGLAPAATKDGRRPHDGGFLGSFDDTEDDDLALAEPQPHERRALAALAAGLWARHPAARRRRRAAATRASTSGADDRRAWRLVPVAQAAGGVGGDDDFVATVLGVVGVSAVADRLADRIIFPIRVCSTPRGFAPPAPAIDAEPTSS